MLCWMCQVLEVDHEKLMNTISWLEYITILYAVLVYAQQASKAKLLAFDTWEWNEWISDVKNYHMISLVLFTNERL